MDPISQEQFKSLTPGKEVGFSSRANHEVVVGVVEVLEQPLRKTVRVGMKKVFFQQNTNPVVILGTQYFASLSELFTSTVRCGECGAIGEVRRGQEATGYNYKCSHCDGVGLEPIVQPTPT